MEGFVRIGIPTYKKLVSYTVRDNCAYPDTRNKVTIEQKKFFRALGALYDKDNNRFVFPHDYTPGQVYALIEDHIEWDVVGEE